MTINNQNPIGDPALYTEDFKKNVMNIQVEKVILYIT